jgi:N-acetylglucosamine malate deacetylase 2
MSMTEVGVDGMRIMTVYAHPDDEAFGPSATLAHYARNGAIIHGIFATTGEEGNTSVEPRPSPSELASLREQDTRDAAGIIDYQKLHFLRYHDGTLENVPQEELTARIYEVIKQFDPHVMTTFGPAGITGHPDHLAVHRSATAAFFRAREAGLSLAELYFDSVSGEGIDELGIGDAPDGQTNTWIDVSDSSEVMIEALRIHGRHILDAVEAAKRVEQDGADAQWGTFHRAWPEVTEGTTVSDFMASDATAGRASGLAD